MGAKDIYVDCKTDEELLKVLIDVKVQSIMKNVGFCIAPLTSKRVYSFAKRIFKEGFPLQVQSSELTEINDSFFWNEFLFRGARNGEVRLTFHFPFWGSIFRKPDDFMYKKMMRYLSDFRDYCKSMRIQSAIVMHPEYPQNASEDIEDWTRDAVSSLKAISKIGLDWFMLENMSGNKNLPQHFCGLQHIGELINQAGVDIKICLDTEHLYAMGEDYMGQHKEKIKFIHLNAIPDYVDRGRGLDRHSYTFLRKTKDLPFIQKVVADFYGSVPMVFERLSVDIMVDDLQEVALWHESGVLTSRGE